MPAVQHVHAASATRSSRQDRGSPAPSACKHIMMILAPRQRFCKLSTGLKGASEIHTRVVLARAPVLRRAPQLPSTAAPTAAQATPAFLPLGERCRLGRTGQVPPVVLQPVDCQPERPLPKDAQ